MFGSRRNLTKLSDDCRAIIVGSSVIQCTDVVRDLGVLLDSEMSMQRHISKVSDIVRLRQTYIRGKKPLLSVYNRRHSSG